MAGTGGMHKCQMQTIGKWKERLEHVWNICHWNSSSKWNHSSNWTFYTYHVSDGCGKQKSISKMFDFSFQDILTQMIYPITRCLLDGAQNQLKPYVFILY